MTADVIKLVPEVVGENYRIASDDVLVGAMGREFHRVVVVGQDEHGDLYLAATANAGESLILMERAKHFIVFGHDDP